MPNIYYEPEEFGLSIVGKVDFSSGYYEFDYLVVWQDENGTLYYGEDNGCSCPSPFEEFGRTHLIEATPHDVVHKVQQRQRDLEEWREEYEHTSSSAAQLIEKVMSR